MINTSRRFNKIGIILLFSGNNYAMEDLMLSYLRPDLYYENIFAIDPGELQSRGIRGLICDIDNTIVPWSKDEVLEEVIDWFAEINERGYRIVLVSNGLDKRVNYFSQRLDIPAIGRAVKPRKKAFRRARKLLELENKEIAVVGDQIFTDVLGGNRLGFLTILVDPMDKREFITTRILRLLEKLFYRRGGNYD